MSELPAGQGVHAKGDTMITIFNILFPIISIILLGYIIGRTGNFREDFFPGVNRLVYRYGLAPMLFIKTATMSIDLSNTFRSIGSILILVIVLLLVSWFFGLVFSMPARMKGAFIHCTIRGNYAYIGLPVVFYAFSHTKYAESSTEIAILIFTPAIILHNVLAILVMIYYREEKNQSGYIFIFRSLIKDPLIVACVLGLIVNLAHITIPTAIARTGTSLGKMALPLALIGIGATIDPKLLRGALFPPFLASFLKTVLAPAIMYGLLLVFGISINEIYGQILMLLSACSVGVSTYIITEQYGGDTKLAGSAVFISAVMSIFSLSAILLIIN